MSTKIQLDKNFKTNSREDSNLKFEAPKRNAILNLSNYMDQEIRVKFIRGRQVTGKLKGYDQLMNLVLCDAYENLRDPNNERVLTEETRNLGLVVVRCTSILTISPVDGSHSIENPFLNCE